MWTAEKYALQIDDAADKLGIKILQRKSEVSIFLSSISWEGLTLWKAIKDIAPDMIVFWDMIM